jgi:hypothetical protein
MSYGLGEEVGRNRRTEDYRKAAKIGIIKLTVVILLKMACNYQ